MVQKSGFSSTAAATEAVDELRRALVSSLNSAESETSHELVEGETAVSPPKKKSLLWSSFDKNMVDSKNVSTPPVSAQELEMRRYLEDQCIAREEDPLKCWKTWHLRYPNYQLTMQDLANPATSVPSERLFKGWRAYLNQKEFPETSKCRYNFVLKWKVISER